MFPDDAGDRVSLLETADAALYRAKNSGRNQWVLAGEALETRAGSVATAEAEIAAALASIDEGEAARAHAAGDAGSGTRARDEDDSPQPLRLPRAG